MRIIGIALFIISSAVVASAQINRPFDNPSDLVIVNAGKKPASRMKGPAEFKSEGKSALSDQTEPTPGTPIDPPHVRTVMGFSYQAMVKNVGRKEIRSVTWDYVFFDSLEQTVMARHSFKSKIKIPPGSEKKLEGFSDTPPTKLVNAKSLNENPDKPYIEQAFIIKIEYADGSTWERPAH